MDAYFSINSYHQQWLMITILRVDTNLTGNGPPFEKGAGGFKIIFY
jgi:hypothetical protein